MDKKYSLLISTKTKLSPVFENKKYKSQFNIFYAESEKEILEFLENNTVTLILLDENFILSSKENIIKEIENKNTLKNALNDNVTFNIPIIAITENNNLEIQKKLYSLKVFECFMKTIPSENLSAILYHICEHFCIEQRHLDISQEQHKTTIKQLINIDKKTGVFNKTAFLYKTHEMLKNNPDQEYLLILMNLDRFKVFNDIFGFAEGDKVLEKIGSNLREHISQRSTYGHIYADHFVICTPKITTNQFNEILKKVDHYVHELHQKFNFIMRYGMYVIKGPETDISLAIDRAELALNSIKQDFTTRYAFYNESMIENLKEEQELISDMVIGLERDEFLVYLQPQYDYTTESLIGAEALVRWKHPEKGLISPALFVPLFEQNGFITQLDQCIWEKTCQLLKKWKDQGLNPVPVSVNISRRDIYNHDLVKIFTDLLKKYNLTPNLLRLEITESAYMDNPAQLIQVVENLRKSGFCLEMDDFGSGYSSLNTLKEVPVDILKLDMKFISSETKDVTNRISTKGGSILSSVVRMANWLHLPVIAEGIESKEQADYLKSIGCFHMQGFYFAKPLPVEEYEKLLINLSPANIKESINFNKDDISNFLDINNHAGLLFNSFIGGAAIIEWAGDTVEALQMNDNFYEEIGTNQHDFAKFKNNIVQAIVETSQKVFLSTLAEVTKNEKASFCEIQLKPLYKNTQPFWIRTHLRHIGKTITSNIYYMSIENIDFRMQLLQMNTNLSEELTTIMENVPCGILTVNFGDKIKASFTNEAAASILGYKLHEFDLMVSENPFSFFLESDREIIKEIIYNSKEDSKKVFSDKIQVYTKKGELKNVLLCGDIYDHTDGSVVVNLIFIDFEKQRRLIQ